jgi:hypothetical protein
MNRIKEFFPSYFSVIFAIFFSLFGSGSTKLEMRHSFKIFTWPLWFVVQIRDQDVLVLLFIFDLFFGLLANMISLFLFLLP